MGKTRDLLKKMIDTKGTFHAKLDVFRNRFYDFTLYNSSYLGKH